MRSESEARENPRTEAEQKKTPTMKPLPAQAKRETVKRWRRYGNKPGLLRVIFNRLAAAYRV